MIYLLMVFIWPLINYCHANLEKINSLEDILILSLFLSGVAIILFFMIRYFLKISVEKILLSVFLSVILFFSYGSLLEAISILSAKDPIIRYSYIYILIFILLVYFSWILARFSNVQKISRGLVTAVFFLSVIQLIFKCAGHFYADKKLAYENNSQNKRQKEEYIFQHKPNVYYILLDAYARQDTLKEVADYDNTTFLESLEAMGFIVSRAGRSNYHFTGASLSATMKMGYHESSQNSLIAYEEMHEALKGNNSVRKILRDNGYTIINIPAHWHQMRCYGYEDICLNGRSYEVFQSFLATTPLKCLSFNNHYVEFESIENTLKIEASRPKFIFAHIAHIHDAAFDEEGNFHSTKHPIIYSKEDATWYIDSIKWVNKQVLNLVRTLRKNDPAAVIIIQADHGPTYIGNLIPKDPEYWLAHDKERRLKTPKDYRYTYGIFSAVYLPNYFPDQYNKINKYFSGEFTLLNTFRYIFSYLSGQEPALLPEESIFLYPNESGDGYKEDDIRYLTKKKES